MASILRSSKFVRYIAGFARNIVVNTPREFDGSLVNTTQCFCGAVSSSFATQASVQHDQSLERSLRRIDQDVRRAGRISRQDIEDVLEEIRNARSATSSQSLLVIRCCGNLVPEEMPEIRTNLVQEIWNTLKKLNVPMDVSHYNALLRVYLENEHEFSPTDFLSDMETRGIEPNRVTYQRLISRYCQIGDIEGATKILEFMREKQLPVNENVFNALINGHSQSGDMDSAQGILTVMAQAGLEPSADTYTTLLCGYAKIGDLNTIMSMMEECEKKEIYLLDKDFLDVVYALAVNGHKEHVPVILDKTRKAFGYGQEAINLILRLVNKRAEDVGYLVMKSIPRGTKPDGSVMPIGTFFIKQLVKANYPAETIFKYCKSMEEDQLYDRSLLLATELSLQLGNETLAYPLLELLQKEGVSIRQHYFWPLIVAKGNDPTGDGIVKVLEQMYHYNITPTSETIREYVIPNIKGKSSDVIAKLRDANISLGSAACSLVYSLLQKHDIAEASVIISRVPAYYPPELMKRPLTLAFYATQNLNSYITILRYVYEYLNRFEIVRSENENDATQAINKNEVVGQFLLDLAYTPRSFAPIAEQVLAEVVNQGLSITTSAAEKLEDKLGEKMTSTISDLLAKLTSGELQPLPLQKKLPAYTPSSQMNEAQLERLIQNLEAKNQDTKGLKRQLLTLYYRSKELDKLEKLLEEVKSQDDFIFTPGIYAQLMDAYAYHYKYDEAVLYFNKLKETDPDFSLDDFKILRYVAVLVKNERLDEAIEILEGTNREKNHEHEKNFQYNSHCWRILNQFAELGKAEELDRLFNCLLKNDFIEINNVLLGPLIKVHLVNKDLAKALQKFEWCCNQFKATPWKNELTCQLIQAEDAENLQKLTDLSTAVHGEINSLYDLVFSFVECGRIRQARKILETPGLQSRPQRINSACQRYQVEGLVKPLEDLKDATKDLNHIDRSDIYYQLLLSYIKQNDPDKALGLWTQMQEEDMAPTDHFLTKLGTFLQENNIQVPFIMPKSTDSEDNVTQPLNRAPLPSTLKKDIQLFRQSLRAGQVDKALEIRQSSKEQFSANDISLLIELLIQNDRLHDATKISIEIMERKMPPITRVFRFLLNKLASSGDVETIEYIGTLITSELKKLVSFDNRICHANLIAGKAENYLNELEASIDKAEDADLAVLGEKFPRGGAVGILEKHPELVEKYESLAIKYAARGIISPLNVLWSHYFIKGDEEAAEKIWKNYLQDAPRIMFQRVVQNARENKDEVLTRKLLKHLKTSNVTPGAIGNAYSCLLDVLVAKGNVEEVITTFESALQDVPIDYINRTAVLRVRDVYTQLNKPFNYKIPPKINNKNTSTSSSASSEADKKH